MRSKRAIEIAFEQCLPACLHAVQKGRTQPNLMRVRSYIDLFYWSSPITQNIIRIKPDSEKWNQQSTLFRVWFKANLFIYWCDCIHIHIYACQLKWPKKQILLKKIREFEHKWLGIGHGFLCAFFLISSWRINRLAIFSLILDSFFTPRNDKYVAKKSK